MADDGELPDLPPDILAKAEAALAGLNDRYLAWAEADSARLRACIEEAGLAGADRRAVLARLFTIAHDMKGQAATFGYPLVTELGNRICRLVEAEAAPDAETLRRLESLVEAIGGVVAGRLSGDGGEAGRRLLERN